MATNNEASIVAVMGQSGQGKGLFIKDRLRHEAPARIAIWDPMDEYGEFAKGQPSLAHLVHATLKRAGAKLPFAVRYIPKGAPQSPIINKEFQAFCATVREAGNCTVVIEELSFVTRPSYAPPQWGKLCNAGRHAGIKLFGASQFPAQIDKSFLSNATEIVTFYLGEKNHRVTVAEKLDVEPDQIRALQKFNYLHFVRDTRNVKAGVAVIPGQPPSPVVLPGGSTTPSGVATPTQQNGMPPVSAA